MTLPMNNQIKRLEKRLAGYQVEVKRAQARALNDVNRKIKPKLAKSVASAVSVKQSVLKKQIFTGRAKSNSLTAYVKSYLRPISAVRLLSKGQLLKAPRGTNRKGVRVAGKQFNGAFINRGRNDGKHRVMQRKGKARYPVKVISIKIADSVSANQLPLAERYMREDFVRIYERELRYRAGKYAG